MRNILFVQQYIGNWEAGPIFPIGLSYLVTAIKHCGWSIKVLDLNLCDNPQETLSDWLESFHPDVVGFSLRNIDNVDYDGFHYFYQELTPYFQDIKNHGCVLIVGGAGFTIFAHEIFSSHQEIDYGIIHEGEQTLKELLRHIDRKSDIASIKGLLYQKEGKTNFNGSRVPLDFSSSEIPDRDLFEMPRYNRFIEIGVQTKRGCSLECSYCTYPHINRHAERFRSIDSILDEIEQLVDKYHIHEFVFCDDIFNVPLEHSRKIVNGIISRGIRVKWSAWFDIKYTDEDFVKLCMKAGCYRFCFSVEALTDESLRLLKKNFR